MITFIFPAGFSTKYRSSRQSVRVLAVKSDGEFKYFIRKFAAHFCSSQITAGSYGFVMGHQKQVEIAKIDILKNVPDHELVQRF